jgi:methylene-tetrahydromethanopterin dehydrogenase
MVACAERQLDKAHGLGLSGRQVCVFGATGVVGFAAGVIAGEQGSQVVLAGYDGTDRVEKRAAEAKERFGVDLAFADASSDELKEGLLADTDVIFCAGRAGTQVLNRSQIGAAPGLKVIADVNAVPPAGLEGVGVMDDGADVEGSPAVAIGAMTMGNIKYQVEQAMFRLMLEAEDPVYLDFNDAFKDARERVA